MSILVDDRAGSAKLAGYINKHQGVTAKLTRLKAGDCHFIGRGPDERPIPVGIEVKTLSDALNSMCNGRFAGTQLPGLTSNYEVAYLIVQDICRPGPYGELQVRRGGDWKQFTLGGRSFTWYDFEGWVMTMELVAKIRVRRTSGDTETAAFIVALYRWFTAKSWEEHRAHLAFDESGEPTFLVRPSLLRRIAKELPGIGWEKSKKVEEYFDSVEGMVNAPEKQWQKVEGIGAKISSTIWHELRRKR